MKNLKMLACAGFVTLFSSFGPVHADSGAAEFASGAGTVLYVGGGTLLPLLEDKDGSQHALRTADTVLTATLISEGLKRVIHEKRPDGSDDKSFPSTHSTAAFAVATMQSHYHPRQSWLWYVGATAIGVSRVKLRKHRWHDVLAGAAIGYFTSKIELNQSRGLILRPLIHEESAANRAPLVQFSHSF